MKHNTFVLILSIAILSIGPSFGQGSSDAPYITIYQQNSNDQTARLDINQLKSIIEDRPLHFKTSFSLNQGEYVEIQLTRALLGKSAAPTQVYYHGAISNDGESLIALTINQNGIFGFLSNERGNFRVYTNEYLILEIDNRAEKQSAWKCTSELHYEDMGLPLLKSQQTQNPDTLMVYFECDYALYTQLGSSVANTENYVYQLFNQVQALYANEQIEIGISGIKVWTQQDPYAKSSIDDALISFRSILGQGYNGNFAHLLSGVNGLSGGVAFLNGICNRSKSFAYSHVDGSVGNHGSYSWDVHVVAHELGHNLGSPHTHDCVWGPNGDEPIDGCASSSGCNSGTIPSSGGTIMSYCHQNGVGVNFSHGFGLEPGNLIRERVNLCAPGDSESCNTAMEIFQSQVFNTGTIDSGSGAHHSDAIHARWYKFTAPSDGSYSISSCGQNVDTRLYLYTGSCGQLTQIHSSDDDCLSGNGFNYASTVNDVTITGGTTLYIEWDDRWSNDAFQFEFLYSSDQGNHCTNGVRDADETGVDCGGSCAPCFNPCQEQPLIPDVIDQTESFSTQESLSFGGQVSETGLLILSSETEVTLENDTEVQSGGQLEISIAPCSNTN